MTSEPKTNDEEGRARALERFEILDTEVEQPFENIVNLVQQTLHVPICAVSLIDRHRQWFKARRGLDVCETARDISFCTHAIQKSDPYVIGNAGEHPMFRDNPLVTGAPHIRAYLGIPLTTPDGYNIGTLCAIDVKPRNFNPNEISILENLAKIVSDELELRQIASYDGLTGALTRRAWRANAEAEIKRATRYNHPLSLVVMDLDKFKSVNDRFGHPAGDLVIRRLAQLNMARKRQSDIFGRFGGEEFVLLLAETGGEDARAVVERLRAEFAETPIELGGGERVTCTFSAGVAELAALENLDTLLARADRCLYEAKEAGRNRIILDDTVAPCLRRVEGNGLTVYSAG